MCKGLSLRRAILFAAAVTSLWLGSTRDVIAQARSSCPPFIAERAGGIFYPRKNYRCFSSAREARRAGFETERALDTPDYSGWWRLNLTLDRNSCGGPNQGSSATTYFFQIKQDGSGVFGALCPGTEMFIGATPSSLPARGFSMATKSSVGAEPFCGGGLATISYSFEATNFDRLYLDSRSARLTRTVVCAQDTTRRCMQRWNGLGQKETTDHSFWPQISNDLSRLGANCTQALASCQSCHGG